MSVIERSNSKGRFSIAEIQTKTRESRAFWNSPEGIARKAQLDTEARNRKPGEIRFPSAAKGKLIPSISTSQSSTQHAYRVLETQAAMNRGEKMPTVSERREALRKIEAAAATTDSKTARLPKY